MTTFLEAVEYDRKNVSYTTYEGAEAASYTHSGLGETVNLSRVRFSKSVLNEDGGESRADVILCWIIASDLVKADLSAVTPQEGGTVTRVATSEAWEVEEINDLNGEWMLTLELRARPVPR